jgi:catechol 2,3-dioxygenase-like lactoylglutathione lyase family enzyme
MSNIPVPKVIGLGGLFFKSADPAAMQEWYGSVLGLAFAEWGGIVFTPDAAAAHPGAATVFAAFKADSNYFAPSDKEFMFNLMVDDLDGMLIRCAEHGVQPFAPVLDPEGRKIELWEPKAMA